MAKDSVSVGLHWEAMMLIYSLHPGPETEVPLVVALGIIIFSLV